MPRVWNKHDGAPPDAVYVGRPSKWGNPYREGYDGTRVEVIARFARELLASPERMAEVRAELRGKDLVCWCAPRMCHANVLLSVANAEPIK